MNVNLWFARNSNDEIVSILDSINNEKYICPICNSEVIPKAVESKKVSPHFAHIDKSKCDSEAMIHFWFKHKFIERGDSFTIKTDKEYTYICKDFKVEKQFNISSCIYRPDVIVETECGEEIVFEMANTNKKKVQDYIDRWIELDKIIVEVDIKSLSSNEKVFNALYYKGKCFNFNKRDCGYYDTYMRIKSHKRDDNLIDKVKGLEWFWIELNDQSISDSVLFEVFETFSSDEKMIFIKSSHTQTKEFMHRFLKYKRNHIINKYKHLEGFVDFYRTNRSMSIYNEGNGYCAISKTSLNLYYETLTQIYKKIERYYSLASKTYKKYEIFNRVNNCKNLTLAINELDAYLKNKIDNDYHIHLDNTDFYLSKPKIVLKYRNTEVFVMKINLILLNLSDKDVIYQYIIKKLSRHISIKFSQPEIEDFTNHLTKVNAFLRKSTMRKNTWFEFNIKRRKASDIRIDLISKGTHDKLIYSLKLKDLSVHKLTELVHNIFKYNKLNCIKCGNEINLSIKFIDKLIVNEYEPPKRCGKCKSNK